MMEKYMNKCMYAFTHTSARNRTHTVLAISYGQAHIRTNARVVFKCVTPFVFMTPMQHAHIMAAIATIINLSLIFIVIDIITNIIIVVFLITTYHIPIP